MNNPSRLSTKKLVLTALMAALTVAGSWLRVRLPLQIAGQTAFHLGNIFCALSGLLLGPWLGGAAAGLGSAIFDMLDPLYLPDCWITFLTKGLYGLIAGLIAHSGKQPWGYVRATLASAAAAVTYGILYLVKSYFYSGMLLHGLAPEAAMLDTVGRLPATVFNAAVAVIFAPMLGIAIRKALKKSHLMLE